MEAIDKNRFFGLNEDHESPGFVPHEGDVLAGRYLLMKQLAEGGTSLVYRARDMLAITAPDDRNSHLAIKIIKPEMSQYSDDLAFYEALTTRNLSHPYIVRIFDYHRENDTSYITMELLEGETLADVLRRNPEGESIGVKRAWHIFRRVSQALEYAHLCGVIHSDMKPGNVMVTTDGRIKVIDFATARSFLAASRSRMSEPESSVYGFTLAYASPDIAADLPAAPADDVFSLACIFYEMLTGKHPFGRKPSDTLTADDVPERPKELDWAGWLVLKNALAVNRERRIQTVTRFRRLMDMSYKLRHHLAWTVSLAVLVGTGVALLSPTLSEWQQRAAEMDRLYEKEQQVVAVVERLESMPVVERQQQLFRLEGLDEAARQRVKLLFLDPLEREIDMRLERAYEHLIPDFDGLLTAVDSLSQFYPDSSRLEQLRQQLLLDRQGMIDLYRYQLGQEWAGPSYGPDSAANIKRAIDSLEQLGEQVPWNEKYLSSYQQAISSTLALQDYRELQPLRQFATDLQELYPQLMGAWSQPDAEELSHALALSDYLNGQDGGMSAETEAVADRAAREEQGDSASYPDQSIRLLLADQLAQIKQDISNAWLDKEIIAAWNSTWDLIVRFDMPAESTVYQSLVATVDDRLASKMMRRAIFETPTAR